MYSQEDRSSDDQSLSAHGQDSGGGSDYDGAQHSQPAINEGQRYINYALTVVDKKIGKALEAFKAAIEATPGCGQIDFRAVNEAIADVYKTSKRVADIKPPGCATGWPPEPQV